MYFILYCNEALFKIVFFFFTGKVIVLKQNNNITDEWLHAIGMHRPMSLTISQCHGDKVTAKGLRDLFRNCSDSLEVLALVNCFPVISLSACIYGLLTKCEVKGGWILVLFLHVYRLKWSQGP